MLRVDPLTINSDMIGVGGLTYVSMLAACIRTSFRASFLVLICTILLPSSTFAQSKAFSATEVTIEGAFDLENDRLYDDWKYDGSAGIRVSFPFHIGRLHVVARAQRFQARTAAVPKFNAIHLWLGLGLPIIDSSRFRFESVIGVGNYYMRFDEATLQGIKNESEFAVSAMQLAQLHVSNRVSLHVGGSVSRVYTFIRMNIVQANAGITVRLQTPSWLKGFLE